MQRKSWFQSIWGLIAIIVLVIVALILLIWATAGVINAGFGLWAMIFIAVLVLITITGAIFSEGFRSFLLRITRRRK